MTAISMSSMKKQPVMGLKKYQTLLKFVIAAIILVGAFFTATNTATKSVGNVLRSKQLPFELTSTAFSGGGSIPVKYTDGLFSPPLSWTGVPNGTKSLCLILDDPDAPDPKNPKMTWVHWVVFNIPPDASNFAEGASGSEHEPLLPNGSQEGLNDWKKVGYGGPSPPVGRHRYFHKLYALDTVITGLEKPTKAELLSAMKGHILGKVELIGTYEKVKRFRG